MLKENNWLITEEKELATVMNNFFVNITESLDLKKDDDFLNPINSKNINDILEEHKHHLSVHAISWAFRREGVMNLDSSKATPTGDISVDILKSTVDIHLLYVTNSINLSIEKCCFPEKLKLANLNFKLT